MAELIQQLVNGISLGGQYALLALGLAAVFSVLGLINFAHGELITIPGYVMLGLYTLDVPWVVMAVGGVLAGGVAAVAMERIAFRPVRRSDGTTMLLTSFGLAIVIQSLIATLISPRSKSVPQPEWLTESVGIAGVSIQWLQILAIAITFVALGALTLILRRTLVGVSMRASAQDFDAARLLGVNANRVVTMTFAISGLLAGIAAVLYLARLGSVSPTMGLTPVLLAFVATVIGGIGDLRGAVAGGFALGLLEAGLRWWLPPDLTSYTPAFLFAGVALLLLLRPGGIFGSSDGVRV